MGLVYEMWSDELWDDTWRDGTRWDEIRWDNETRRPFSLQWRHNERDGVSNHQHYHCLLNRLFRRRSRKTLKLRVTGLCVGNSPVTGEFPAQMASNTENVSIWWRHHGLMGYVTLAAGTLYLSSVAEIHLKVWHTEISSGARTSNKSQW